MAVKGTLIWLCSLAVWSASASQDETPLQTCNPGNLTAALEEAIECGEDPPWSARQSAALLLSMRSLTDSLHKHQLKECQGAAPNECPAAEVPKNGGLACATVANKRYCKPLCNHGYDFGFLRRNRLYDECSEETRFKWNTQYIAGNTLAVCNEALIQVSGATTAYFPKDQDCLTSKNSSHLQSAIIEDLTSELKNRGIQGEPKHTCLVCG